MFTTEEILKAAKGTILQGNPKCDFSGVSIDSRKIKPGDLFIAIKGNNFDGHNFVRNVYKKGARGAVVSKDINFSLPSSFSIIRAKDTTIAFGDIAKLHRLRFKIPIVAVTGSNGKTTTKEIISFILKKKLNVLSSIGTNNNQIGVPLTLLRLKPSHEVAVVELGTNHPGEIDYLSRIASPTIAIITNIGPSHLEFFKNLDNVYKEKKSLFKTLGRGHAVIINKDDKYLSRIKSTNSKFKLTGFSIKKKSDFTAEKIKFQNNRLKFILNSRLPFALRTPAYHNIYNCLAAIACCKYLRLDYNCIQAQVEKFNFPPGRLEVKHFNNITVIDDTYNANPLSFKNAVDTLTDFGSSGRKVLVCADMLELGKCAKEAHASSGKYAADSGVEVLISVGKLAKFISEAAFKAGMCKEMIFNFPDTQSAFKRLPFVIRSQDIVLVKGSRMMHMEKVVEFLRKARF